MNKDIFYKQNMGWVAALCSVFKNQYQIRYIPGVFNAKGFRWVGADIKKVNLNADTLCCKQVQLMY
jgi:hypothetical protein